MSDLRSRAAAGTLDRVPAGGLTLADRIPLLEEEFARALPNGEARQIVQDALTCLRTIPKLDQCEPRSVLGALMTCAQLGLRPGVLGHAWPLPFWDSRSRGMKAQLIIGYQGYIHLGYLSDRVADFSGRAVRENDTYEVEYGLNPSLIHRPARGDRGTVIGYYATFRTTTGGAGFHDMTHDEVCAWRDQYAPRGKPGKAGELGPIVGPWRSAEGSADFIGMGIKTQLRQVAKWMPKSPQLATAAQVDGTVRVDVDMLTEAGGVSEPVAVESGPTGDPCEFCTGTTDRHTDDACPGLTT